MELTRLSRRERLRAFHEKFVIEVRALPAQTKRSLYVWAASLITVGLVGFTTVLAAVVSEQGIWVIDAPFIEWLHDHRSPLLTAVMVVLAVVFGPVVLPVVILVVTISWGLLARHAWRPLLLAGGMLAGLIVVQVSTRIISRPRPPAEAMLFGTDTTFSFPSGHVAGAADFLLLIAYLVFSRRKTPAVAVASFVIAACLIATAAVSRIYLGYHWATDALGSVSLSLVVLGTVIAVDTHRTVRALEPGDPGPSTAVHAIGDQSDTDHTQDHLPER